MKALIIDDEPLAAKDLEYMIDKHCFEISSTEICLSASKAIDLVEKKAFDLIFLDIEMPEMNGFDFIEHAKINKNTKIIITTAYEQYAIEAFQADAIHYLVKPVKEYDLVKAVRKAFNKNDYHFIDKEQSDSTVSIFDDNMHHIIKQEDIIRLEADGNYTKVFLLNQKKILSSKGLNDFEEVLSTKLFLRPHRSHLINLKQISQVSKGTAGVIVLSNDEQIPISRSRRKEVAKALGL